MDVALEFYSPSRRLNKILIALELFMQLLDETDDELTNWRQTNYK